LSIFYVLLHRYSELLFTNFISLRYRSCQDRKTIIYSVASVMMMMMCLCVRRHTTERILLSSLNKPSWPRHCIVKSSELSWASMLGCDYSLSLQRPVTTKTCNRTQHQHAYW